MRRFARICNTECKTVQPKLEAWLGIDLVIQSERFTKSAKHTFAVLDDDIGILCGARMAMKFDGVSKRPSGYSRDVEREHEHRDAEHEHDEEW